MRLHAPVILSATLAMCALALSCDQSPPGPTLPTADVHWAKVTGFDRDSRVSSLWANGPDDIYAFYPPANYGDVGVFSRYNGTSWSPVSIPIEDENGNPSIWGSAEDDVYVAVDHLHHFDGVSWSTEPIDADLVAGISRDRVFAASGTAIVVFDGAEWDTLRTRPGYPIRRLSAAPDGSLFYSTEDSISIWDGAIWTDTTLPDDHPYAVIGFAHDSAFAFGYTARTYRWDGVAWTAGPSLPQGMRSFAATSATDVYAVGTAGRVLHFDGVDWHPLRSGTHFDLISIAVTGSSVIVGGESSKIQSWNGSEWQVLNQARPRRAYALFAESPSHFLLNDGSSVFRFDHGSWEEKSLPEYSGGFGGSSLDDVYTGTGLGIFHFDGSTWTLTDTVAIDQGRFWRAPSGTMYSIGRHDAYRSAGTAWERIDSGEYEFDVIAGDGGDGIVVAGKSAPYDGHPIVVHFDGSAWHDLPAPDDDVFGFWCDSGLDLYVAGLHGLYRWNGAKFKRLSPPDHGFTGVFPLDDGRIVALGLGEVGLYDGYLLGFTHDEHRGYAMQALDGSILFYDESRILSWRP